MPSRVKTGLLFAVFVVSLAIAGGWFWASFVLLAFLISFRELSGIMQAKNIRPSQIIVLTVGPLLLLMAAMHKPQHFAAIITAAVLLSFFRLVFRQPRASISDIGATMMAIFYLAYLPAHFILLRDMGYHLTSNPFQQSGLGYLFFTILVISASDIAAYYSGKRFGKHLLYPEISPKKTREGALGGLLGGLAVGLIFAALIGFPWEHALILGTLLVIVGQLGDLSESLLKRDAGIKDSGTMLPGHGGVLDRMDSYIFSGAVSYYYIYWFILHQGLALEILRLFNG
jgi:phosphatidate cytidylyltransferase